MIIELKNFSIECDKELDYMDDIIDALENRTYEILSFFKLKNLSKKKKIVIFTDREKYKEHMLKFVTTFMEWMCADTNDGNINLLELSEAKKAKAHKDMDLKKFIDCVLHEFVHACHQEYSKISSDLVWFWEALATNLSGQDYVINSLVNCDFNALRDNFKNTKNCYGYAYTLGNYMLNNYSSERILNYVRRPDDLRRDSDIIFEEAKAFLKII